MNQSRPFAFHFPQITNRTELNSERERKAPKSLTVGMRKVWAEGEGEKAVKVV